ncbi:Hypothetical protein PHPALM_36370 [Phytophthora palmivora]|uniref:Uncharacterized protein n=1 Tax=Phytophthora palmivora TaxID=4796 RepID=A0A2P4X038_9STRA|nr:Hypothetical protein PHPALM_36370 [Phytophthora palmivora]
MFGMYLAFKESRNIAWRLKALLTKRQVLNRYCMKSELEAFVNKVPACTNEAPKQEIMHLYSSVITNSNYDDAAL